MQNTQTTTPIATQTTPVAPGRAHCEVKLRRVLRVNATTSGISGVIMAAAAGPLDELLETGYPGWVRLVGLALLPFAALCLWVAAGPIERLRSMTPEIVIADVAWVVASAATIALGWYSGIGIALVAAMAATVAVFAAMQWHGVRRLG